MLGADAPAWMGMECAAMAERSFAAEVEKLRIGEGEVFRGEGGVMLSRHCEVRLAVAT